MVNLKLTVVGDGFVGKTCILASYVEGKFPEDYIPTVFENHATTITIDGQVNDITLWDTAGQEDYERLRPLSYPNTSCFLICFSVNSRDSFDNIVTKWVPELRYHKRDAPYIIVGTKIDLRDIPTDITLSQRDGEKLAKRVGAKAYVECSSKQFNGLDNVFETAARVALNKMPKPKCTIL